MNLDDAIVLETFSNRIEAEMAAGLLESEGIEAMVMADDAGGTYPMLQFIRGVRLMVFKEDEARAKEILAAMAEAGISSSNLELFSSTIIASRTPRKMKNGWCWWGGRPWPPHRLAGGDARPTARRPAPPSYFHIKEQSKDDYLSF